MFSSATIDRAKQIDLLSYLQQNEPHELVHVAGQEYTTRTHDSLKISNGIWHWFSKGIGGKTALDYLIHVRGMDFSKAVLHLIRLQNRQRINSCPCPLPTTPVNLPPPILHLPEPNIENNRVIAYLLNRGIDRCVIDFCIENGTLYESVDTHNAGFIGTDKEGNRRHAMIRGIGQNNNYKKDAPGSDKRFTFSIQGTGNALLVFESPIDALSLATLEKQVERDWLHYHYLSLCGVAPLGLDQYLKDHPNMSRLIFCLDNDETGQKATAHLMKQYSSRGFNVSTQPPPTGKDYNDHLINEIQKRKAVSKATRLYR